MKVALDYHMHTNASEDGNDSLEVMCKRAIILGIPEIGFSEHWDVSPYEKNPKYFKIEPWFEEILRLQKHHGSQLVIRAGIEIAEPHLYPDETSAVLKRAPFDYVIGSVHWVGSNFMFDTDYFKQGKADDIYLSYFDELEQMVSKADIDIVAHFDIPARTAIPILGYEPICYEKRIRSVLEIIIKRELSLEINTAGLRKPANNLMPDPIILKWYKEGNGHHVTLGSDAHRQSEVGLHIDTGIKVLHDTGIFQVTQFQLRQKYLTVME